MRLEKFGLVIAFLAVVTFCIGQRVSLRDFDVKANYWQLPKQGLPTHINTFHVEINSDESALKFLSTSKANLENQIVIGGYERLEEAGAKVVVTNEGPKAGSLELKTTKKKNKEGKTWNEYHYEVESSGSAELRIEDDKGGFLHTETFFITKKKKSGTFRSVTDLKKNFNAEKFYLGLRRNVLDEMMAAVQQNINYNFSLLKKTQKVEFEGVKGDKHRDARKFNAQKPKVIKAFEAMTIESIDEFKELIQPSIDFWKEMEPKYSGKDKKERKLKYACQINLSRAYFWMEDFANAKHYATMIKEGSYKEKNGKRMLKDIAATEESLNRVKRPSRHFKIEASQEEKMAMENAKKAIEEAIASGDVRAYPDFDSKMQIKSNSQVYSGTIHKKDGTKLDGYFAYESDDKTPDFRVPSQIRFGYDQAGELKAINTEFSQINNITIDGKEYNVKNIVVGTGLGKLKLDNAVIETVKDFNRTSLVIICPPFKKGKLSFGGASEMEPELIVYNKAENAYQRPDGLSGYKSAMKGILKGCPSAIQYIEEDKKEEVTVQISSKVLNYSKAPQIMKALELFDGCK